MFGDTADWYLEPPDNPCGYCEFADECEDASRCLADDEGYELGRELEFFDEYEEESLSVWRDG